MSLLRRTITKIEDGPMLDAFGRQRVSNPDTVFDSKTLFEKKSNVWDELLVNGATSTHLVNRASVTLNVTTTTGSKAIRQSKEFCAYQPGKSQLVFITSIMGSKKVGVRQRIGCFYENNGLFFEQDENNLKVVVRSYVTGSVVDTAVNQSDWNIDKLDGTGVSGLTIDTSKTQIFYIDYEWLGVGRVRFGFVINGQVYLCHEVLNANNTTSVYMSTPNLPIRYEIESTGTPSSDTSMECICSSVMSEGGFTPLQMIFSADNDGVGKTIASATEGLLLQIRLRSDRIRFASVIARNLSVLCTSTANFMWVVRLNPTITGGTASWNNVHDCSCVEYDVSRVATVSGGLKLASGYSSASANVVASELLSKIKLLANIAEVSDVITLSVYNLSNQIETFYGSLSWLEQQ